MPLKPFDTSIMFEETPMNGPVIDNMDYLGAAIDSYGAQDVPMDFDTANPYSQDMGVPAGSGYQNMDAGVRYDSVGGQEMMAEDEFMQDGEMEDESFPEEEEDMSGEETDALRDEMIGSMTDKQMSSDEYQQGVAKDNVNERKMSKRMGY